MPSEQSWFKPLQQITGAAHATCSREERLCYSYDATGRSYIPDAVVFPGSEEEVSRILQLSDQHDLIVVPRGAGSGMTGGAVPVKGGIVMVFTRMNQILELDENNFWVKVQPGVVVADIHAAVEKKGLFYPPDPASASVCTIGGNIGECAGGPRAVKYGVTRDYVLGLRVVLASGNIIETGVKTAKGVAGYDLTRLIVGSEGTLGIVTEITLKLLPKPETIKTLAVFFDNTVTAAGAVSKIMKTAVVPRCVEYLDKASLELVKNSLAFSLPQGFEAMLIIEVDGSVQSVEDDSLKIETLCKKLGSLEVRIAKDDQETVQLWGARKALSPVLYQLATNKINEDIVVPIDRIPDLVEATHAIKQRFGLPLVCFGHAGDGNIHCNIMYEKSDPDQAKRAHEAVDQLFSEVLALGGTITGEHGVGMTKQKYLPQEVGEAQIELMQGIKKVFDPKNLLNPGKIFN